MTTAYQENAGFQTSLTQGHYLIAARPAAGFSSYSMANKALKSHNVQLISGGNILTAQVMHALRKPGHSIPN